VGPTGMGLRRTLGFGLVLLAATLSLGWSARTTRYVAWSAVEFYPADLARQVRRHHDRFDAGITRGLNAPPAWRAAHPGRLPDALEATARGCAEKLLTPIPLDDLVEELGVLAVLAIDANDPLAVGHSDAREPQYSAAYQRYVDSVLARVRLVYYGGDDLLFGRPGLKPAISRILDRSRRLYPFVGEEFYRTGRLRDWRQFDDRSIAFGVAGVSLARALTDSANLASWVWAQGGGRIPTPRPTPIGHVGDTVILAPQLGGGFESDRGPTSGRPALGDRRSIGLPPSGDSP
jgi:hypothetical protein